MASITEIQNSGRNRNGRIMRAMIIEILLDHDERMLLRRAVRCAAKSCPDACVEKTVTTQHVQEIDVWSSPCRLAKDISEIFT